jgi:hypothetical protein
MKPQTQLISEDLLVGQGMLFCKNDYLGECDYNLKVRRSMLQTGVEGQDDSAPTLITTVIGTISVIGNPYGSIYHKRNQLTLHLTDDYLMPLCAFPSSSPGLDYKIYGRVITQPTADFEPF